MTKRQDIERVDLESLLNTIDRGLFLIIAARSRLAKLLQTEEEVP
ncbi:MAG: hypothetical protein WAK17_07030 [Candidatus Nitrosopolaris sp.]|jgi:hypothetical protein